MGGQDAARMQRVAAMFAPLRPSLAGLAAVASLQALLLAGTASAQGVRMFEEAPPLELLRSIMVPESQPGLSRRIVITNPDRPASMATQASVREPAIVPQAVPQAAPMPAPMPVAAAAPMERAAPMPAMAMAEPSSEEAEPAPAPAPRRARPHRQAETLAAARLPAPSAQAAAPAAAPGAAGVVGFRINFALNSDVVPLSAQPFVERIGELLREQPQIRIRIEGHTDALGSDAYNMALSHRRAMAVATYLVDQQGVDAERLVVLGLGESAPLTENGFDPRNRRVQFARVE
jgi:OmpA-OmpF porin, OOP family